MATSKYDQNALQLVHTVHCCLQAYFTDFFCQGLEIYLTFYIEFISQCK